MIYCDRCQEPLEPQPNWEDQMMGELDFRARFENWQELERYIVCLRCHLYLMFAPKGDEGLTTL